MELVYLWVEDYKNIHKQGFNFSPRFECKYENNELTINENDDYIENFFGENINVTAIVGKNGSGKSNLLELFFYASSEGLVDKREKFFIVYFSNQQKKFIIGKRSSFEQLIKTSKKNIFLTICNDFDRMTKFHNSIYFNNFYKNPHLNQILTNINPSTFWKRYDISLMNQLRDNKWNVISYYLKNVRRALELLKIGDMELPSDFSKITSIKLTSPIIERRPMEESNSYYKKVLNSINYRNKIDEKTEEKIKNFLGLLKDEYSFEDFPENFLDLYLDISVETGEFLNFEWNPSLSTGEETLLFQFANFYSIMKEKKLSQREQTLAYFSTEDKEKPYYLYIDEGENTLHPNWQRKYISYIVQFLKDNFSKKKIHIILTTHSPFLLSDIPKQKIIFLNKDEKTGNCIVVKDGLKEKKQTFGANIHTLLSDSFFMEDGLMGEFAKGKIDKAIKLLNQDKLDEKDLKYCEQIISIIGEPIVKNQLQRMLDSKRLKKIDEIEMIKKNMDAMQKRLDELEK